MSEIDNGPVVVAGVCGSGTRVVADILAELGFFIGNDLNSAKDNLLFTLLFKRPKWYYENNQDSETINTGLSLLQKVMTGKQGLSKQELGFLLRAVGSKVIIGHQYEGRGRGIWPLKRLKKILGMGPEKYKDVSYVGWGWKEPHSLLLIRQMNRYFDSFRYIHELRHGLDMAFSDNQEQLHLWGRLFGVEQPRNPSELPAISLRFWARVNQDIIQIGEEMGPERFLLVDFDELCTAPYESVQRIVSFLDIEPNEEAVQRILKIPKRPASTGRYQNHDLNQFAADDLAVLQQLGFPVVRKV